MSGTGTIAMTPHSFVARVDAKADANDVKVTAEMIDAVAVRAAQVTRNDLREYGCMHRGDHTVYATIERDEEAIVAATEQAVHRIVRDLDRPLPRTCDELSARLREPGNREVMRAALQRNNCWPQHIDFAVENFGKMMRKLAKETQHACNQGQSL